MKIFASIFSLCLIIQACTPKSSEMTQSSTPIEDIDDQSSAQISEARTRHLNLQLKADFNNHILSGTASWDIEANGSDAIYMDVRDLEIEKITLDNASEEVKFATEKLAEFLGSKLKIPIKPTTKSVHITYSTSPDATAVQWLEASQTAGKKHPFLFTQGQAILTRSWIPCQDSPGIRITYDAKIEVPNELMAVMSAENPKTKNDSGIYNFQMKQPIPPYLIALAIGDLEFGSVGPRTGIYTEPSVLPAALYEFADMENMLIAAEGLYGPYQWEQYDLIILPPSFPFGGMENPRLTFTTPTVIAGDRSLTSLVAHELAHSWSGNLVTNATWNDFWLNEGFTVYFERRIMEKLYGKDYVNMLAMLGYQDLKSTVDDLGSDSKDTHLFLDLKGRDADDGMTDIAYEKGAYFLTLIEQKVGREDFDNFLKKYFDSHKFQSMTTSKFVAYLNKELLEPKNVELNIDEWIYGPGIPANCPQFVSDRFENIDKQIAAYGQSKKLNAFSNSKDWSTHEWLHFLRHLPTDLSQKDMKSLDTGLNLTTSGNSEILDAWFELSIKNGYYKEILPNIENFLVSVGRRKFLTPLYKAFKEVGDVDTAKAIYQKAKANYHHVSRQSMEALLGI